MKSNARPRYENCVNKGIQNNRCQTERANQLTAATPEGSSQKGFAQFSQTKHKTNCIKTCHKLTIGLLCLQPPVHLVQQ